MSSVISPHLHQFQKEILSLVPYANNDRLAFLIKKLLPEESSGRHLAIKNEIKKLAQQCRKTIDLRTLFNNCEIVKHNQINHYLDPDGKALFQEKLTEYQNIYTIAIYHDVTEDARDRAEQSENDTKQNEFSGFKIGRFPRVNPGYLLLQLHSELI